MNHDRPAQEKKVTDPIDKKSPTGIGNNNISGQQLEHLLQHLFEPKNNINTYDQDGKRNGAQDKNNKSGKGDNFQELRKLIELSLCNKTQSEDKLKINDQGDKGIELSFELEIDESLKDLLLKPSKQKKLDNLLDVTLVQECDSKHKTTLALGYDEVSHLLQLVNKTQNADQNKRKSKFSRFDANKLSKKFNLDLETTPTTDSEDFGTLKQNATVYTTPQHTFDHIRRRLPCQTTGQCASHDEEHDKGTPCLCQHCGMVGLLVESQKRPVIAHTPNYKFSSPGAGAISPQYRDSSRTRRRLIDLRSKSKSETNLILLKELTNKIASLESRLDEQDEKTVKKDYFKFVIHKLLSQYSSKINELKHACRGNSSPMRPTANISTQYSVRNVSRTPFNRDAKQDSRKREYVEKDGKSAPTKTETIHSGKKSSSSELRFKTRGAKKTSPNFPRPYEPSIKRSAMRKFHRGSYNNNRCYYQQQQEFPTRIDDSCKEKGAAIDATLECGKRKMSAHALKNACDVIYTKYYNQRYDENDNEDDDDDDESGGRPVKEIPEMVECAAPPKNRSESQHNHQKQQQQQQQNQKQERNEQQELPQQQQEKQQRAQRMDVAYVSPALKNWHDYPSEQEFGSTKRNSLTSSDNNNNRALDAEEKPAELSKHTTAEKIQYLHILALRKNVDETELWTSILNQAKRHVRSNKDTVSIQLPSSSSGPSSLKDRQLSELELTLQDLKDIVKKSRKTSKNKISASITKFDIAQ